MWSTKSRMNLWIYDWSVKPILNSTSAFWPNKTEPEDWCWSSSCHLRPETIAHSSTSSLRRLPLSRIPSATNGIPSKCAGNGISGKLEPAAFRSNSSQDNHWWDRCPRIWTISCHRPFNWKLPLLLRFLNLAPSLVSFFSRFFSTKYFTCMTIMLSSQDGQIWELPWQHGISTAKALLILMCNNNDYGAFVWKLYLDSSKTLKSLIHLISSESKFISISEFFTFISTRWKCDPAASCGD